MSALEDANRASQSENENLRDLLSRLQEENSMLKQTAFTFSVPRGGGAPADSPISAGPVPTFGAQAGPSSATAAPPPAPGPSAPSDIDWSALTTFDPSSLNLLDEPGDVPMDFSEGSSRSPYKTIASNPMFMSFAEPYSAWDTTLAGINAAPGSTPGTAPNSNPPSHQGSFDFNSFGSWTGSANGNGAGAGQGGMGSLEDLFGMQQGPMDLAGLVPSPSQISPVSHAGGRPQLSGASSSSASSASSPNPFSFGPASRSPGAASLLSLASSDLSSPPASSGAGSPDAAAAAAACASGTKTCPRTKADFAAHVASQVKSPFAPDAKPLAAASAGGSPGAPPGATIKKAGGDGKDGAGQQILCQGSVFPKTEKSERNVEVLAAWRSITSNPQFKVRSLMGVLIVRGAERRRRTWTSTSSVQSSRTRRSATAQRSCSTRRACTRSSTSLRGRRSYP